MKPYHFIFIFILAGLTACGNHADEPTPTPPDTPPHQEVPADVAMTFAPESSPQSRADAALEDTYKTFKVWSYKHTSSKRETVMPGYTVKYIDAATRWQYDGTTYSTHTELAGQYLKYWDESALSYDFYSHAPLALPTGIDAEVDDNGHFIITGLEGHTDSQPDIVIAHQQRHVSDATGLKDIDALTSEANAQQPTQVSHTVPLRYHRPLVRVEYRIYNTGTKTAEIDNIRMSLDEGCSIVTAGTWTDGVITSTTGTNSTMMTMSYMAPTLLEVEPIKQADYKTKAKSLVAYYELPQSLPEYVNISIESEGAIIPARGKTPDDGWQIDKTYIYYIHIAMEDGDQHPILIDLTVDDFVYGGEVDEIVTDW